MDASGVVMHDEVAELKDRMMALNIAQLQHILNYLQHKRDDLLICYSLPFSWFQMDIPHFRVFKEWLLEHNVIDLEELVSEIMDNPDTATSLKEITSIPLTPHAPQNECVASSQKSGSNAQSCACASGGECDAPSSGSDTE